ncbi:hypothetical protein HWB99_gp100 [Mycobacterium phage DrLupo]|uniref:Uncharacterized protein n=1 Tax=Mycobacterium phage DrLupo TaxID=2499037 RepID=A0A3S9UQS7_9CAUD|nr:hypothetical protein HWB99_gp100 [Mycobacterium phage DrLupo]AZS12636.1 hypothetical protein SEA_DRLUPO_100 [Mycobacterium phage DrLupo]
MANTEQKPQKYTVTAEVELSITATSIPAAYKEFTNYMAKIFNDAFAQTNEPVIVASSFEGLAIARDFANEQ